VRRAQNDQSRGVEKDTTNVSFWAKEGEHSHLDNCLSHPPLNLDCLPYRRVILRYKLIKNPFIYWHDRFRWQDSCCKGAENYPEL